MKTYCFNPFTIRRIEIFDESARVILPPNENDSETFDVTHEHARALMRMTCPVIPAEPGWLIILKDGENSFFSRPIVAWRIDSRNVARPVCVQDYDALNGTNAFVAPDGKVFDQLSSREYASFDSFKRDFRANMKAKG